MLNTYIIHQLNDSLQQWKDMFLFYERDTVLLSFTVSPDNQLCFNHMPLYGLTDLTIENTILDLEQIRFQFNHSRSLVIRIGWPEEQQPYAKSVFFGYFFLPADHNQTAELYES